MVARGSVPFGKAVALATSHPLGVGGSRFHYATRVLETDSVYMGAWRREVYAWAGGFDEEMACNEDDEFSYRLRSKGGRIVLDPAIRSVYYNRSTVRTLWRQYFRYGLWKVRVAQKVPRQIRPRHVIPFAFVGALVGGGLLAPLLSAGRLGVAGHGWRLCGRDARRGPGPRAGGGAGPSGGACRASSSSCTPPMGRVSPWGWCASLAPGGAPGSPGGRSPVPPRPPDPGDQSFPGPERGTSGHCQVTVTVMRRRDGVRLIVNSIDLR